MATLFFTTVLAQTAIGDVLYPFYLVRAKPILSELSAGSRSPADTFDVKEHFAFFALALAIGVFALTRKEPRPTALVRVLFGLAHGTVILVAALGLVVASIRMP